jgi:N4-gp56 family major capsid protein
MTGIINPGNMPPELQLHYSEKFLSTPAPKLIYGLGVDEQPAENYHGKTTRLRGFDALSTDGGQLDGSGIDPAPELVNFRDVDATMEHFAKVLLINDQVTMYSNDKTLNKMTQLLGQWLSEKEDRLLREVQDGAAGIINCTGGNNNDNPTEVTASDLEDAEMVLLGADAKTILESIQATDQVNTSGSLDAYIALCNTDIQRELRQIPNFKTRAGYPGATQDYNLAELGTYERFRFFGSSKGSKLPNFSLLGRTVYNIVCKGVEAVAKLENSLDTARVFYRPPYLVSSVEQNAELAGRFSMARAITNQSWIVLLRCTKDV